MARLKAKTLGAPSAKRQITFHQLLVAARRTWLRDALSSSVDEVDLARLDRELHTYAPRRGLKVLANAGIRGEFAFPTPVLLREAPKLLGYYRLLLGQSAKSFYRTEGWSGFKSMEVSGSLTAEQRRRLPDVCRALGTAIGELVENIAPSVSARDLEELPLLTLGAQFQGANNVEIGKTAAKAVFVALREVLGEHVTNEASSKIEVRNSAGRRVVVTLHHDPDVRIEEEVGKAVHKKVAIEIKGGTDSSNVHNRAGEAEKSHQKANNAGYRDFWTLISLKGVDVEKLKSESPTTKEFMDLAQILAREGVDWETFRGRIAAEVGVPIQ